MKTNKFIICILLSVFIITSCSDKSTTPTTTPPVSTVKTAGTLTIATTTASTDPTDPTGVPTDFGPSNCVAIWIEDNNGKFVKTLTEWGITRKSDLVTWKTASSYNITGLTVVTTVDPKIQPSLPQPDATTGATLANYGKMSCTWNAKDLTGAVVTDGTYKVKFEITDNGTGGITRTMTIPFTKGPTAVTPATPNVTSFGTNSVSWVPAP